MKKVVFIGNRLNVLRELPHFTELQMVKMYVQEGSLLHKKLPELSLPANVEPRVFAISDKAQVIAEITDTDFDLLISNGCPLILPVGQMQKGRRLFVNIHPTLLPDLKGKTPLNGVFLTHRQAIGATMHYIDPGIDTGHIIAQAKTKLTPDLDQGLVYKISFDLESLAFKLGMQKIIDADYDYPGTPQVGEGSYFNRTDELQTIDLAADSSERIIDKIKSFGVKGQGTEVSLSGKTYRIYAAEKIVNDYLTETYLPTKIGEIAFEYNGKFVFRASDGLIRVDDFEQTAS